MGRPKLSDDEKRTKTVRVPLTESEHVAVKKAAALAGFNVADWLRRLMRLDRMMKRKPTQPRKRRSGD